MVLTNAQTKLSCTEILKIDIDSNIITFRCEHCKAMSSDYEKLAKWMKKKNPNLLVAKMDATENDIHAMFGNLKGYPTIFFLPMANKEQFVQYQEETFVYKSLKVSQKLVHSLKC